MESLHLGDLGGDEGEVLEGDFVWFSETFRLNPDLTDLALLDMVDLMGMGDPSQLTEEEIEAMGGQAMTALRRMGDQLVHPDDADRFWSTARKHRQNIEQVSQLAGKVIAGIADRPTPAASDSSDGQPATGTSSTAGSSGQAMAALEGRPDLQVAVLRAVGERQAV